MMKITYIGHRIFVEMEDACFLFDYYKERFDRRKQKMYVFVSHRHHDHYNRGNFQAAGKIPGYTIYYFFRCI